MKLSVMDKECSKAFTKYKKVQPNIHRREFDRIFALGYRSSEKIRYRDPRSKLKSAQVMDIYNQLQTPYHGINVELAERYDVKPSSISDIKTGRAWASVTGLNRGKNRK